MRNDVTFWISLAHIEVQGIPPLCLDSPAGIGFPRTPLNMTRIVNRRTMREAGW